jgi:hypothetical protein
MHPNADAVDVNLRTLVAEMELQGLVLHQRANTSLIYYCMNYSRADAVDVELMNRVGEMGL